MGSLDVESVWLAAIGPEACTLVSDDRVRSELKPDSGAASSHYRTPQPDYRFSDPVDSSSLYFRSDYQNFVRNGMPIIFCYDELPAPGPCRTPPVK
jgi:hypothetical protein